MCTLGRSIAIKNQQIGEVRGEVRGEEKANRSVVMRLLERHMPLQEIADIVNESVETVRKWIDEAGWY